MNDIVGEFLALAEKAHVES